MKNYKMLEELKVDMDKAYGALKPPRSTSRLVIDVDVARRAYYKKLIDQSEQNED